MIGTINRFPLLRWLGEGKPKKWLSICTLTILFNLSGLAQPIKAITFNSRFENPKDGNNRWELRKSSVKDFLVYEAADFVGMQEVLWSQIEDLQSLHKYKWIGVGRDDGEKGGEFSPIFYKDQDWNLVNSGTFWLSETPAVPSKSWDAALPRICTWGQFRNVMSRKIIYVFNTHFDHVGSETRKQAVKIIITKIQELTAFQNTILLGDFNLTPESEPMQSLIASPMNDAFDEAIVKFGSVGTFNGFNYSKIPTRRIDYVFVSPDLKTKSYSTASQLIEGRYLSDHFPVIVRLVSD